MGTVNNAADTSILPNKKSSRDRWIAVVVAQQFDLMPLNSTLKMVNFVLCVFPQKHFLRALLFSVCKVSWACGMSLKYYLSQNVLLLLWKYLCVCVCV